MALSPQDHEGGALLWSSDGTLVVRKTAAGYRVIAEEYAENAKGTVTFDVQQDDIETFIDQLKRLAGAY